MSSEVEFLIKLRDAAAMILDGCERRLETLAPVEAKASDKMPDMSMIVWKNAVGDRGPFEIAEAKANANNACFDRLQQYLKTHNGKATVEGFFLWLFSDSNGSIGRKLARKS